MLPGSKFRKVLRPHQHVARVRMLALGTLPVLSCWHVVVRLHADLWSCYDPCSYSSVSQGKILDPRNHPDKPI